MHRGLAVSLMLASCAFGATGAVAATSESANPVVASAVPAGAVAVMAMDGPAESTNDSGWEISFTPYLWMSGVHGEVDVSGEAEDIDFDKSFTDLLKDFQFGYMGSFNARKGRLVFMTDLLYFHMETDVGGLSSLDLVDGEIDQKVLVGTALAGYRVVDKGPLYFDVLAGLRHGSLDVEVDLDGPLRSVERDASESKVSPVLGARLNVPLGDKWGMLFYGDASSLFTDSAIKWQLLSTIHYDISHRWRIGAGYRYMKIRASKGDIDLDMSMNGPILAFTHKF